MSELTMTEFKESLKDLLSLERLLAEQEVLMKVFRRYSVSAVRPVPFKNVATMGMFTLTGTWFLLDIFAFMTGHPKVGLGCTIFTIVLALFFGRMKLREKKITEDKVAEFEEYIEQYKKYQQISEMSQNLKAALEKVYEQVGVFPRYREMNAVSAMLDYIESGRAKVVTGEGSAYKIYESELSRSRVEDVKKSVNPPVDEIGLVPEYLEGARAKMEAVLKKYETE